MTLIKMTYNNRISILSVAMLTMATVHCQEVVSQEQTSCGYSSGSMALAVILTFLCTLLVIAGFLFWWKKRQNRNKDIHLILETDPERGVKAEYAFDNPGFKDTSIVATSEKISKPESSAKKWGNWSPLSALNLTKSEKKRALDDLALENHEVKVVSLKSQDFTGLGFNICGNMKEGIYIKDILHRGPAFESGKLNAGDRINSVTISFEHMVYEDALSILSYASPYEVMIEAKSGRIISYSQGQGQNPVHPIYRSSSLTELFHAEKSAKKKLFGDDYSSSSNYSSLQKSRSNVTTLERKESKSPRPNMPKMKKSEKSPAKLSPEILKTHLEQKTYEKYPEIREDENKIEETMQKTENRGHKFGVRVLPMENQQMSPKIMEQNQNNMNIEKNMEDIPIRSIDEVDDNKPQPPQARKREKKSPEPTFMRNDSGIRRDKDGIPLEIPDHMHDAALMARRNRKSSAENIMTNGVDVNKKSKGKAPSPPADMKLNFNLGVGKAKVFEDLSTLESSTCSPIENNGRYGSDSEEETDNNMSSVNTIELNSSDITIHQTEEEERKARKTASTGDLSKMKKIPRSNTGTLERAQSLDITDSSGQSLVKMRTYDATENLLIDREPRLSLILDGLTTFQRNRLKKSTEWGNLEDAILNFNQDNLEYEERRRSEPQFNAVLDRVIQIKRESADSHIIPDEVVRQYQQTVPREPEEPKVSNRIWPDEKEITEVKVVVQENTESDSLMDEIERPHKRNISEEFISSKVSNQIWPGGEEIDAVNIEKPGRKMEFKEKISKDTRQIPVVPERTKVKVSETNDKNENHLEEKRDKQTDDTPLPTERISKIDLILESNTEKPLIIGSDQTPDSKPNSALNLFNQPSSQISIQFNCEKPKPPKRERTPETETVINLSPNINSQPLTTFEKQGLKETCSQIAKERRPNCQMIKDEWEIDTLNSTSPPVSMTLVDEVMESYNKNYGNVVTVVRTDDVAVSSEPSTASSSNIPDENKKSENLRNVTKKFILNEQSSYEADTNICDDVKVSLSSYESSGAKKIEPKQKLDDSITKDSLVSHVIVTENGGSNLHSLELSINNDPSELYTTALDNTILKEVAKHDVTVITSKPEIVTIRKVEFTSPEPIVEITENSFSRVSKSPGELPTKADMEHIKDDEERTKADFKVEITESKYSTLETENPLTKVSTLYDQSVTSVTDDNSFKGIEDESPAISLTDIKPLEDENGVSQNDSNEDKQTYITEIQVLTPTSNTVSSVTEFKIMPQNKDDHLENAFENYVKNFESKLEAFESNMQNFENNLEEFIRDEPKSIILEENSDVEMQVSKIQEIAEEQLKTLPEMRFTTSSYEADRKTPEKRHSFELLRSNFEKISNDKSPPRRDSTTPPKSRIPISTTMKTPPMSPERRDSRNLENENDKAILELMSSSAIHSTPFTSKIKPPSISTKNVSVTSIKNNSKIPSGLPTLSSRPPIPPRKSEDNGNQVSSNGNADSSFKQWVFNPNGSSNITNVTVGKDK